MKALEMINFVIMILFGLCYFYQAVYLFIPVIFKNKRKKDEQYNPADIVNHRFAVMIAARNEQEVIGQLIKSIKNQNYPAHLIDIYVVADNCTDNTAKVCLENGAIVFERFNTQYIGKGYAIQYLSAKIREYHSKDYYDGFFIFDADNILDRNYVAQMNILFSKGARIITGYRNSKNFSDSWISSGYALWFMRESQFLNLARESIGTSSVILGTGFLFHKDIINRTNGWNYLLMSEDMEFTVDNVLRGETIHYCPKAVLYDEQPTKFSQSFTQRARWVKGYLQVFSKYGLSLVKEIICSRNFSCYDISMSILPAMFLTIINFVASTAAVIYELFNGGTLTQFILPALGGLLSSYAMFFFLGILTVITERRQIHCPAKKLTLYVFTFPIFMLSYIPIAIYANFSKVTWKPIEHNHCVSLDEIEQKI